MHAQDILKVAKCYPVQTEQTPPNVRSQRTGNTQAKPMPQRGLHFTLKCINAWIKIVNSNNGEKVGIIYCVLLILTGKTFQLKVSFYFHDF